MLYSGLIGPPVAAKSWVDKISVSVQSRMELGIDSRGWDPHWAIARPRALQCQSKRQAIARTGIEGTCSVLWQNHRLLNLTLSSGCSHSEAHPAGL